MYTLNSNLFAPFSSVNSSERNPRISNRLSSLISSCNVLFHISICLFYRFGIPKWLQQFLKSRCSEFFNRRNTWQIKRPLSRSGTRWFIYLLVTTRFKVENLLQKPSSQGNVKTSWKAMEMGNHFPFKINLSYHVFI